MTDGVNPSETLYLNTDIRNLSPNIREGSGSIIPRTDYNHPSKVVRQEIDPLVDKARQLSIEPGPRLKRGFELAKNAIINLRSRLGAQPLHSPDMEILLLRKDDYAEFIYKLTGEDVGDNIAGASDVVNPIFVTYDNHPDYIISSLVFHEFVHKHLELTIRIYSTIDLPNEPEYGVLITEPRRSGLSVVRLTRKNGEIVSEQYGELLNELSNYELQRLFIKMIFEDQEERQVFSQEIEERNNRVRALGLDPNDPNQYYRVKLIDRRENPRYVLFRQPNIHFEKSGEHMMGRQTFLSMQLMEDLRKLVGTVGGESLSMALLRAKVDPRLQNRIRQVMNKKVGPKFYERLKSAEYNIQDVIDFLVEVQNKLYGSESVVESG